MKLTPSLLKRIVQEEVTRHKKLHEKFGKAKEAGDVETEEQAWNEATPPAAKDHTAGLEETVNYAKALKLEEARIRRRLARIAEARRKIVKKIAESI